MADLSSVFDSAHLRQYPKGQILLYQGQKTNDVFQIKTGHVKVYDVSAQGNEKLLMILGPDDIFPLVWTFRGSESLHYFYETFNETEVCVVPRETLIKAVKESHAVSIHLLEYFVNRTKELMSRIECIEATSAKHKVAQVMTYLAVAHGNKIAQSAFKVELPVTHQAIADMAGITRETASLQLKDLEKSKQLESVDNGYIVHVDRIEDFLSQGD